MDDSTRHRALPARRDVFAFGVWWMREHRMAEQRRTIRSMMSLSEEVLSANSVGEISRKIQAVLPNLLKASKIDLYLLNRINSTLDRIPDDISAEPVTIAIEQPKERWQRPLRFAFETGRC